jgi:choline dehydrogenase-like flavoprotein
MATAHFDVIVIGSGAGGGTLAHALAATSARILVLERGDFVPQEAENWSPEAVWQHLRYRSSERWLNGDGHEFLPYTHYSVGGNTKFWGSVLFRLRREDFEAVELADGVSPAWPITYDTLAPYYDQAERLYQVHGQTGTDPTEPARGPFPYAAVPHAPRMAEIVERLARTGLHPFPLPLGLRDGCVLCRTCNSFPCKLHAKSDADVCCVREAVRRPNVTLWTNALVSRLHTDPAGKVVESVEVERNGETIRVGASVVVVSCGAVNSAALLLRSAGPAHPRGLANSSGLVGTRYMAHVATMLEGIDPRRTNDTEFQKTVAINDYYFKRPDTPFPLGQIQSQGRVAAIMAQQAGPPWLARVARRLPLSWFEWYVSHGVDWLVMSEDLPHADNRVTVGSDGRIRLRYRPSNLVAHRMLVRLTKRMLRPLGLVFPTPDISLGASNTTHQCGTVCFGTDPRLSVLDPFCRTHDVRNLFVVDASFFPSSAAVNPGLTIVAVALRVADHIKGTDLQ